MHCLQHMDDQLITGHTMAIHDNNEYQSQCKKPWDPMRCLPTEENETQYMTQYNMMTQKFERM